MCVGMKVSAVFRHMGFFDLLCDAAYQYRLAAKCTDSYEMNRHARASISAATLTLECGANCLLETLAVPSGLREDLDRMPTLSKYDASLRLRGFGGLDRGRSEVQKVVELVRARNDFVHPKGRNIKTDIGALKERGKLVTMPMELHGEIWKGLGIPRRSLFWSAESALSVLKALAEFLGYVFAELMSASPDEANQILVSRVELGDVQIRSQFEEFERELMEALHHGVDVRCLGVGQASP